jgi:putative transcriptional regulator
MELRRRLRLGVASVGAAFALGSVVLAGLAVVPGPAPAAPYASPKAHIRRLAAGRLLVASRQVTGPFFGQSVVLLIEHSDEGALGLVLNRPTRVPLSSVLPDQAGLAQREDRTWVGGPVGRDTMRLLIREKSPATDLVRVVGEVHTTTNLEVLRRLLAAGTPSAKLRAYVGYAGWGPRQLAAEVLRGDWYVDDGSADWVFDRDPASMWRELLDRNSGTQAGGPGAGGRAPGAQRTATM